LCVWKYYAERTSIEGPPVFMHAKAAQNFALALHELATNAVKYGALSNCTGDVRIGWQIHRSTDEDRRPASRHRRRKASEAWSSNTSWQSIWTRDRS